MNFVESEEKIILPEYKIELLNKSKKVINTLENIKKLNFNNQPKIIEEKEKKTTKKLKKDTKKTSKLLKNSRTRTIVQFLLLFFQIQCNSYP